MNNVQRIFKQHRWFSYALLLLLLALVYTAVFTTGVLLYPTLRIEQWLLQRPLIGFDCVLREWISVLQAGVCLVFTIIVGIVCIMLGYRRRVLPYLVLLLLLGVGVEIVGKQLFPQPMPQSIGHGLFSLRCPQLVHQPRSVRWPVAAGMWWLAPKISQWDREMAQLGASAPLVIDDDANIDYGYPSGHALRSSFLGLVLCWLCWRHTRKQWLRRCLMVLTLILACSGGFIQFYLGSHLSTDVVAGYLLGLSAACCAIGLLQHNEKHRISSVQLDPALVEDKHVVIR